MVEKQHKNLPADIRGCIKIMKDSGELKFQPSDFFIGASYQDGNARSRGYSPAPSVFSAYLAFRAAEIAGYLSVHGHKCLLWAFVAVLGVVAA